MHGNHPGSYWNAGSNSVDLVLRLRLHFSQGERGTVGSHTILLVAGPCILFFKRCIHLYDSPIILTLPPPYQCSRKIKLLRVLGVFSRPYAIQLTLQLTQTDTNLIFFVLQKRASPCTSARLDIQSSGEDQNKSCSP